MVDYVAEISTSVYRCGASKPITSVYSTCPVPPSKLLSTYDRAARACVYLPFEDVICERVSALLQSWLPIGYRSVVTLTAKLPFPQVSTSACSPESIVHDIVTQLLGYCLTKS